MADTQKNAAAEAMTAAAAGSGDVAVTQPGTPTSDPAAAALARFAAARQALEEAAAAAQEAGISPSQLVTEGSAGTAEGSQGTKRKAAAKTHRRRQARRSRPATAPAAEPAEGLAPPGDAEGWPHSAGGMPDLTAWGPLAKSRGFLHNPAPEEHEDELLPGYAETAPARPAAPSLLPSFPPLPRPVPPLAAPLHLALTHPPQDPPSAHYSPSRPISYCCVKTPASTPTSRCSWPPPA